MERNPQTMTGNLPITSICICFWGLKTELVRSMQALVVQIPSHSEVCIWAHTVLLTQQYTAVSLALGLFICRYYIFLALSLETESA